MDRYITIHLDEHQTGSIIGIRVLEDPAEGLAQRLKRNVMNSIFYHNHQIGSLE